MRLIDADILKEAFIVNTDRKGYLVADPEVIIDNAPTVEPQKIVTIPHELIEKLALCVVDTVEKIDWDKAIEAYMKRPQGEWIPRYVNFTDGSKPLFAYCKCSLCNKPAASVYKFCPNCGAEMKPKTCTNCETFGHDCGDCEVGEDD